MASLSAHPEEARTVQWGKSGSSHLSQSPLHRGPAGATFGYGFGTASTDAAPLGECGGQISSYPQLWSKGKEPCPPHAPTCRGPTRAASAQAYMLQRMTPGCAPPSPTLQAHVVSSLGSLCPQMYLLLPTFLPLLVPVLLPGCPPLAPMRPHSFCPI